MGRRCSRASLCSACPDRGVCPAATRHAKRRARSKVDIAGRALMRRVARILADAWKSSAGVAEELYGPLPSDYNARTSALVRARRPLNKMRKCGLVAVRIVNGRAEYRLLQDGRFLCA